MVEWKDEIQGILQDYDVMVHLYSGVRMLLADGYVDFLDEAFQLEDDGSVVRVPYVNIEFIEFNQDNQFDFEEEIEEVD